MSVLGDTKNTPQHHVRAQAVREDPPPDTHPLPAPKAVPPPPQQASFKSLKYCNEIQTIFPIQHVASSWEEELKTKYSLVEDRAWDKGFEVWRSLPMQSELEQKLNVHGNPLKRSCDFTRKAKPEAYLPGFSSRQTGPISRPRILPPIRRMPAPVRREGKRETSRVSTEDGDTARRPSGAALQDGILRHTQVI